ncbi:MAG: fatty acid desaturase [Deltaproteobacteria bacterium]
MGKQAGRVEWLTLGLLTLCYGMWIWAVIWLPHWSLFAAIVVSALSAVLHSSLTHEAIHGHPTRWQWLNATLVAPSLNLVVPYLRFYDTHHAHHTHDRLTDPYDDPESNYQALADWSKRPAWQHLLFRFNNTLAGRLTLGPFISQYAFMKTDLLAILHGDRRVALGWLLHLPGMALIILILVSVGQMPLWAIVVSIWLSMSILKIRTFIEHQAHENAGGRTVIVEDQGPLALLFLNNNFHAVHHAHPRLPWYQLPTLYFANKQRYLGHNQRYFFASYAQVFRQHFVRSKDSVPHPIWRRDGE